MKHLTLYLEAHPGAQNHSPWGLQSCQNWQLSAACLPEPPWHGENKDFTCVGAWWALVAAPGPSPRSAVAAPAPNDCSKRCVRTLSASGRGANEAPACCLPGKCPQGQGCSVPLLKAFPRVTMPRRKEEFGCQNPQSACKPPRITIARAVRRQPGALVSIRHSSFLALPRSPLRPHESEIPGCRVWQFQSRGGGGSSAQGSLQPGCWGTLMGCGRCGFGPLGLRRERNPGLPLPQHIL